MERGGSERVSTHSIMAADGSASFTDDQLEELCETFKTVSIFDILHSQNDSKTTLKQSYDK